MTTSKSLLDEVPNRPHWKEIDRVTDTVIEKAGEGNYGVDGHLFWKQITQMIDDLGTLVTSENDLLMAKTADIQGKAMQSLVAFLAARST